MKRIVVLSDEDIKDISEGKEVRFEFFDDMYVLVNEEGYKNFKSDIKLTCRKGGLI